MRIVRTVEDALSDSNAVIRTDSGEWDETRNFPPGLVDRKIVATSSWQASRLVYLGVSSNEFSAVVPASAVIRSLNFPVTDVPLVVCRSHDVNTCTLALSVFDGVKSAGAEFAVFGPVLGSAMERQLPANVKVFEEFTEDEYSSYLDRASVFAVPAMTLASQDTHACSALSSGTLLVYPQHSGYAEHFKVSPFSVPWSRSVSDFAADFATVLLEAVIAIREDYSAIINLVQFQKAYADVVYEKSYEEKCVRDAADLARSSLT